MPHWHGKKWQEMKCCNATVVVQGAYHSWLQSIGKGFASSVAPLGTNVAKCLGGFSNVSVTRNVPAHRGGHFDHLFLRHYGWRDEHVRDPSFVIRGFIRVFTSGNQLGSIKQCRTRFANLKSSAILRFGSGAISRSTVTFGRVGLAFSDACLCLYFANVSFDFFWRSG